MLRLFPNMFYKPYVELLQGDNYDQTLEAQHYLTLRHGLVPLNRQTLEFKLTLDTAITCKEGQYCMN